MGELENAHSENDLEDGAWKRPKQLPQEYPATSMKKKSSPTQGRSLRFPGQNTEKIRRAA
jgi:hypothetical protein